MKKVWLILPVLFALTISGCSSMAKLELRGNKSVGDDLYCVISPEGIVREVSNKYASDGILPIPGSGGKFIFKFKAISEGEAEIVVFNDFRGNEKKQIFVYKAIVDNKKRLALIKE